MRRGEPVVGAPREQQPLCRRRVDERLDRGGDDGTNGERGGASSSFSASIFEKSSTSPMICNSDCAEPSAVATIWRCCGLSSVRASTSSMPVTPIIGVRISWLMAARNVDFAWLARSAAPASLDGRLLGTRAARCVRLDRRAHLVEGVRDTLELPHRADLGAVRVVAVGDAPGRRDEPGERADRESRQHHAGGQTDEHDQREDGDLGADEVAIARADVVDRVRRP